MSDHTEATEVGATSLALVGAALSGDALGVGASLLEVARYGMQLYRAKQERLVLRLLEEAYGATSSDPGAFAEFRAMFTAGDLKSENARAVFIHSVRTAESVVDEIVLPALAMLMREYQRAGMAVDAFFRGVSRTLQDLTADEYAVLALILKHATRSGRDLFKFRYRTLLDGWYTLRAGKEELGRFPPLVLHLFRTLHTNTLVRQDWPLSHASSVEGESESEHFSVERAVAVRLLALVAPLG